MSSTSQTRAGIIAGGNWIVDHVKLIDRWPPQDALANITGQVSSNGGSPYNLLKNLARLGAKFPLEAVGLVGDDEAGRFVRDDCARHGIDAKRLGTSRAPTSYTDVMTERGTARRTFFHCRGANAELALEHFDFVGTRAKIFHLGYLLLLDRLDEFQGDGAPAVVEVFRAARAAGLKTSADVVSEASDRFARIVKPVLPHLDYLFVNEFEIAQVTGIATARDGMIDRGAIERAAAELIRGGVKEWVVVHFPAAVYALNANGGAFWQPSVKMPAAEIKGTAGAGDALATGVLYGLHEGWGMKESLQLGVCAAAASLMHPTCSEGVVSRAECLALGAKFGFSEGGSAGVPPAKEKNAGETPALPVALRKLTADDLSFACELNAQAGWNQTEKDWRGYLEFEPEGCFLAEADERRAGTATTISYGERFGWIGMVLVHSDFRRFGIGTKLLRATIDYLQQRGVAAVKLDATPMGKKVYVPLGFVDEYEMSRYDGVVPMGIVAEGGVRAMIASDLADVAAFDAPIFGAPREHVLRSMLGRKPEFCFVARDAGGAVRGFLFAREGRIATQIGPWEAEDAATAERLLRALFARLGGRRLFVDVLHPNPAARAMMEHAGFAIQRSLTRMYLGENRHPGMPGRIFGISSPEKG